jgi:hypothetical protein
MQTTLHVHHRIADYQAWRRSFDHAVALSPGRAIRGYRVWRGEDDAGLVIVEYTFASRRDAESFITHPEVVRELRLASSDESLFLEYLDEVAFADF